MDIERFDIEPELVRQKIQLGGKRCCVENACKCGCSPYPFVYISDGCTGMVLRFQSELELETFKRQVGKLRMPLNRRTYSAPKIK